MYSAYILAYLNSETQFLPCQLPFWRFVPEKFEEIFRKHARSNGNALTAQELDEMLKANEQPKDSKGR